MTYKCYTLDESVTDEKVKSDFYLLLSTYDKLYYKKGKRSLDQFFQYYEAMGLGLLSNASDVEEISEDKSNIDIVIRDAPEIKKSPVVDEKGKVHYQRDIQKKKKALVNADYRCEYNNEHFSFYTLKSNKHMYVEAHHLIPLNKYDEFQNSLDIDANIVCLCPNCHRCIHYGNTAEKKQMFLKLFSRRKNRLRKCGIEVGMEKIDKWFS